MSARTFKATQVVTSDTQPELLGDRVARHVKPIARIFRWPVDCPGCAHRQQWLNRVHQEIRNWLRK